MHKIRLHRLVPLALAVIATLLAFAASQATASTIVRIETNLGNIDIRLFDTATPVSVANFLNYVTDGDYDGSFFHRAPLTFRSNSQGDLVDEFGAPLPLDADGNPILTNAVVDTFVVQGGGFTFTDADGVGSVPTDAPILNEPGLTNLPGTIAYARSSAVNSATSGFFFNTSNNVADLDNQNEGFAVFARVVRGQSVLDAITALPVPDLDGVPGMTFNDVPFLTPANDDPDSLADNLIFINNTSILDVPTGDYNFDGVVNASDFSVFTSEFGNSLRIVDRQNSNPGTEVDSDGNGDGAINAADFVLLRDTIGAASSATSPIVLSAAIPEPTAATTLAIGVLLSACPMRRRCC